MPVEDKRISCVDCGNTFTWTIGEQIFFQDKGLTNEPKRCKGCKQAKTERVEAAAIANHNVSVPIRCAGCGNESTVPFYPTQGRPVYCYTCFKSGAYSDAGAPSNA